MRWFESSHPSIAIAESDFDGVYPERGAAAPSRRAMRWFESSHPSIELTLRILGVVLVCGVAACVPTQNASVLPQSVENVTRAAAVRFESEHRWGDVDDNRWEPITAADPSSSWVYQMTTDQQPDYLLVRASSDGGQRWHKERRICRRGVRVFFQYDPQIAVAEDGIVDAVCLDGFRPGVVFTRSRDHGATWSRSVRLDGTLAYSDKPTLVTSRDGKDIYVAYSSRYALYVTASHDYGRSWSAPVRATSAHYWYYSYGGT